jgi:hypothetical protein
MQIRVLSSQKPMFLSMATIDEFSKLRAGQAAPVYILDAYDQSVIIPKELGPILSRPEYAHTMLYFNKRSKLAPKGDTIPGTFKFAVVSSKTKDTFECWFDSITKIFDKIHILYEGYPFDLSGQMADQFTSILDMGHRELIVYLISNSTYSRVRVERLNKWLKQLDS